MRATDPIETAWYHFPDIGERPELSERKANSPLDEQRFRRNFLTWAFFLAQVTAAERLLTGAAQAQDDELPENPATRSDPQFNGLPSEDPRAKFDVAEAAVVAPPSSSTTVPDGAPPAGTAAQTHSLPLSAIAGHAPPVGAAGAGAAAAGAVGSAQQGHIIGSGGSPNNSLPNMLPDIGGAEQTGLPPITVDIGLTPLLGFDVSIGAGGLISANVGLDLNGLLGSLQNVTNLLVSPLQEVTDLVGSLTNDLGHLLNGDGLGLGGLLQSSPLNLSELTGLTLTDGIAGLLGQSGDNASTGASPTSDVARHEPAVAAVTNASDFATQTLFGSGGVINILGGLTNAAQHDDLYAQGRYTDYNVALRDNAEPGSGDATPDIAAVLATPAADHQPAADTVIADLPHLDDLVTRLTI